MAETKSGKTGQSGHTETEQRVRRGGEEAKPAVIDQGLLELLDAHAKAVAGRSRASQEDGSRVVPPGRDATGT